MIRNKIINASSDYEVEVEKTVFHVHHEFDNKELDELIADYIINEQSITVTEKTGGIKIMLVKRLIF